jgi:DNA-binding transcriptional ArsR family regulator
MALESIASLLRALSDPCRLRLLALCAERPESVSALAAALDETEPTVSRHLKALAAVGVLRRVRRGQRVEYSRASAALADDVVSAALRSIATADAPLARARERLQAARAGAGGVAPPPALVGVEAERRLGEALALTLGAGAAAATTRYDLLLSAGDVPIECLRLLAEQGPATLLVVASTVAERTAQRRRLADAGLRGEVLLRGDLPQRLAAAAAPTSALLSCLDLRMPRSWAEIEALLRWLQRLPVPRSADWVLFDYDVLDALLGMAGRSLLAELRARLAELGFDTRRIQPIEADGQHRLLVHCAPRSVDAARAA